MRFSSPRSGSCPTPPLGGPRSRGLRSLSVFLGVLFSVLVLLSVGVRPAGAVPPPTYQVTTLADGTSPVPAGSLRAAITYANVNAGTVITFAPGLSGTILLASALPALAASVTIQGPGASAVAVDGQNAVRPFLINPGVTAAVSGLTIQNGSDSNGGNGGGVSNFGALTLSGCALTGNSALDGGGVFNNSIGVVTLTGCALTGNSATGSYGTGGGVSNVGTATLTGCILAGNSATDDGGGVFNAGAGALTLTGCTLAGNTATYGGGGVFNSGNSTLTLTGCALAGNIANGDGGGVSNSGTATLSGCTLAGNSATYDGGGVFNNSIGAVTLTGCTLVGNSATSSYGNGGGVCNFGNSTVTLIGCTLTGNSATGSSNGSGGGVYNFGFSTVTLTDDILYGDSAPTGNEVVGSATASHCDIQQRGFAGSNGNLNNDPLFVTPFVSNAAPYDLHLKAGSPCIHSGAALPAGTTDHDGNLYAAPAPSLGAYEYGFYTVNNTNDSGVGSLRAAITYANVNAGAVITFAPGLSGTILLASALPALAANVTIQGPGASVIAVDGNGKYQPFAISPGVAATVSGLTIRNGHASSGTGGGVYNDGTLTLTGCTLTQNSAYYGSGIYNDSSGAATLTGCTLTDNGGADSVGGAGGGVYNNGMAMLTGCTLAGNSAGAGGGVYNYTNSTLTLTGCTLTANNAPFYGGGVYNDTSSGPAMLTDDILYGDSAPNGKEINGPVTVSHCDIQQGGFAGSGNLNADPRLAPLGSYGGPTGTFALLPGSPCLGAGTNAGLTADQRGVPIPQNGRYDIGAFESRGFTVTVTQGSGQSTLIGTAFAQSLTATVTANASAEPVAGGVLTFTGPEGGASATFSPDPATIGSTRVAGVTATANGTPGGPYTVTADTGAGRTTYALSNTKAVTTVALTSSLNPSAFGQSVTFTATLSGDVNATGAVTFTVDGVAGTAVALSGPTAAFTTSALAAGQHTVTAAYSGDANNAGSTSSTLTQTVGPPILASLTFPTPVPGGTVLSGTVSLSGVTPTDVVVGLSSSDSAVIRVHRAVIVPAGSSSATFEMDTYRSHVTKTVTLTANLNGVTLTKDLTITGR